MINKATILANTAKLNFSKQEISSQNQKSDLLNFEIKLILIKYLLD